jgi:predicted O-methyltransferase YrrM
MSPRSLARLLLATRALPARAALFQARAMLRAARLGDDWALVSSTRPADVAELLRLARGRRRVVELGTGPGWTAIALALADPERRVTTYDPVVHDHRDEYLALAPEAAERIEWIAAPGVEARGEGVDLLFIDSTHEREPTLAEFAAWRPRLAPNATVAFHDYGHPDFPGVRQAVEELALEGEPRGGMFVWSLH